MTATATDEPFFPSESARQLWYELLSLPSPAARTRALREPRFHREDLARLLLLEGLKALAAAPVRAVARARQALFLADRLPATARGTRGLKIEAACRLAEARWALGDLTRADRDLQLALQDLDAPLDSRERAVFCQNRALRFKLQGRLDEAIALYQRAHSLFLHHPDRDRLEALQCELSLGLLWLEADRPRRALPLLFGRHLLLGTSWAALGLFAGWYCLLRVDPPSDSERAEVLHSLREPSCGWLEQGVEAAWWAGRTALYLEDPDTAESILKGTVERYMARRNFMGAALTTLGRIAARPEHGPRLVSALARSFPRQPAPRPQVFEALTRFLPDAAGADRRLALEAIERQLRRLQFTSRSPSLPLAASPGRSISRAGQPRQAGFPEPIARTETANRRPEETPR